MKRRTPLALALTLSLAGSAAAQSPVIDGRAGDWASLDDARLSIIHDPQDLRLDNGLTSGFDIDELWIYVGPGGGRPAPRASWASTGRAPPADGRFAAPLPEAPPPVDTFSPVEAPAGSTGRPTRPAPATRGGRSTGHGARADADV